MFKPNPAWVSFLSLFNLHQCVQSPTRVTSTTSTLIDYIYVSNPDVVLMSFIDMRNNKGPNTDPCGTPEGTVEYSDFLPFITTACLQFYK